MERSEMSPPAGPEPQDPGRSIAETLPRTRVSARLRRFSGDFAGPGTVFGRLGRRLRREVRRLPCGALRCARAADQNVASGSGRPLAPRAPDIFGV